MKIITLISIWKDNPRQVERLVADQTQLGLVCVIRDHRDLRAPAYLDGVASYRAGYFHHERDKRNALLAAAKLDLHIDPEDWFLSLDPDERLLYGDSLPELLRRAPEQMPAYPLLRVEPNGRVWAMPSKLFRADVANYTYLDVAVNWRDEPWNLDPWPLIPATVVPGWPVVTHYRSPRADNPTTDETAFYSEASPDSLGRHFRTEWEYDHNLPIEGTNLG